MLQEPIHPAPLKFSLIFTFHPSASDRLWSNILALVSFITFKQHTISYSSNNLYLQHPELSLASYSNSAEAQYDPEGIALVWNSKYKTTAPE